MTSRWCVSALAVSPKKQLYTTTKEETEAGRRYWNVEATSNMFKIHFSIKKNILQFVLVAWFIK